MPLHVAPVLNAKQREDAMKSQIDKSVASLRHEEAMRIERQTWPWVRVHLYGIVSSHVFEWACGAIILFNMVLVVFETDANVDDGSSPLWIKVMTNLLLCIYSTELCTKLYVYRREFFRDFWNVLDFVIVGVDLLFIFIALVVDTLPSVSIFRVFRLVRLARAFKAMNSMHELHSLLRSCACALKAIFWGMVLLGLTLTVWGILTVQLIHPINKHIAVTKPWLYEDCDRCPRAFSTVFDSVVTIWKQIVAGDSWGQLCEPIIEEANWTFFIFVLILVTVALTMLNCILAVVVEAGATAAAADEHDKAVQQEKKVLKAEAKLLELCKILDADKGGSLSIDEFVNGFHNNADFKECLEVMNVTEDDMFMIFNICDEDDSGDVDYKEFVEQLRRIKNSGEQMLLHYVSEIRHAVLGIRSATKTLLQTEEQVEKEVVEVQQAADQLLIIEEKFEESKANDSVVPGASDVLQSQKTDADESKDSGSRRKTDVNVTNFDLLCKERFDRMHEASEQIVSVMADVAQQSKAQTTLLNTLVSRFQVASIPNPHTPRSRQTAKLSQRLESAGVLQLPNSGSARLREIAEGGDAGNVQTGQGPAEDPLVRVASITVATVPTPGGCCGRMY